MKAKLLSRSKELLSDGSIVEMVLWQVQESVLGSQHCYKYSLYYGRDGTRIVAYDNERQKGDHCHIDGVELPYKFTTVEALVNDFMLEVHKRRQQK